jgi:inhibitor of KinA
VTFAPRVLPFGEGALLVEVNDVFDEGSLGWARAMADHWESVLELGPAVPAYASVLLRFDVDRTTPARAEEVARDLLARGPSRSTEGTSRADVEVPTRYDGADLADVAERSKVSVDELISLHTSRTYTAYFLGFLPGFAYCGRLDPRIAAPRLERPRERVPAGAVAVADGQTAIYPSASPGGWRLIGSTDLVLFDPTADPPARIRAGDRVRFVAR